MHHRVLLVLAPLVVVCASARPSGSASATPVAPATSVYARIPAELGAFKQTSRSLVSGTTADSSYRFSDGTRTYVTVFVYHPSPEVRTPGDPQRWVHTEGERFKQVQAIRQQRGDFEQFTVAFSDTGRVEGHPALLEHRIGTPVRYRNGAIAVDMQFLYLIDGKFQKVRATMPEAEWQQSQAPVFARALAGRMGAR